MMTPVQKIKHMILLLDHEQAKDWDADIKPLPETIDAANIDALWHEIEEASDGSLQDTVNEFREGEFKTGLKCDFSRHYESDAVAAKYIDGSYVGWTYWHGGGKHGEPESIDWMGEAYDVACVEEEKLVTVRTFSLPTTPAA